MIGVYNHLLSKVFRFHYHFQKVIGSIGNGTWILGSIWVVIKTLVLFDGSEIRLTSWYGKDTIIYKVLYIQGGAEISSINSINGTWILGSTRNLL